MTEHAIGEVPTHLFLVLFGDLRLIMLVTAIAGEGRVGFSDSAPPQADVNSNKTTRRAEVSTRLICTLRFSQS
jgi:hypothetical protein